MTNTVQDHVKAEWQQVQSEGGQRLSRIRDIFKAASSEAFGEIKAGTDEIQTLSRKSLAEMIAQFKAAEATEAAAEAIVLETETEIESDTDTSNLALAQETTASEVPTWRQLLVDVWHIANDRKGEWTQHMLARLQLQMDQFDADMTEEYGDRYRPFQRLVKLIRALVDAAYNRLSQTETEAQPVSVEILDDDAVDAPAS